MFENWESEFLQMGMLVILKIWLKQKGSADSKRLRGEDEFDTRSRYSIIRATTQKSFDVGSLQQFAKPDSIYTVFHFFWIACGKCLSSPYGSIWGCHSPGLNRFKTGKASFCQSAY